MNSGKRAMPAALTSEELRSIQDWERTHRSPVVRRLLWEVHRLRTVVRQADKVERGMRADPAAIEASSLGIAAEELRKMLDELPWVEEAGRRPSKRAGFRRPS